MRIYLLGKVVLFLVITGVFSLNLPWWNAALLNGVVANWFWGVEIIRFVEWAARKVGAEW